MSVACTSPDQTLMRSAASIRISNLRSSELIVIGIKETALAEACHYFLMATGGREEPLVAMLKSLSKWSNTTCPALRFVCRRLHGLGLHGSPRAGILPVIARCGGLLCIEYLNTGRCAAELQGFRDAFDTLLVACNGLLANCHCCS